MATILSKLKVFEQLDLEQVTTDSLTETEEDLVQHNQSQMYYGEDAKGLDISPAYRPLTVFLKTQKGQPTDRVTLMDEGNFYSGMYARVQGDEIVFDSTDSKSAKLKAKYKETIFGLAPMSKEHYVKVVLRPLFTGKLRIITKL